MDKRLRFINAWYFAGLAVICAVIGVNGLRDNYRHMVVLREAVVTADQKGSDMQKPLSELRTFVYTHMNTNLASGKVAIRPPIQLKGYYERLVASQKEQVKATNEAVAAQATATCQQQVPGSGISVARVTCVQEYTAAHAASEQEIPSELYKFDFKSPAWSADQAGIGLVLAALFGLLFVLRLGTERWLLSRIR